MGILVETFPCDPNKPLYLQAIYLEAEVGIGQSLLPAVSGTCELLKSLGMPKQNARKWFTTIEIDRMSQDPDWLDKAIRIVKK